MQPKLRWNCRGRSRHRRTGALWTERLSEATSKRAATVLLRYCYGIGPMWVAQLTDFEQLAKRLRRFPSTALFSMTPSPKCATQRTTACCEAWLFLEWATGETRTSRIDTKGVAVGGDEVMALGGEFFLRPKRARSGSRFLAETTLLLVRGWAGFGGDLCSAAPRSLPARQHGPRNVSWPAYVKNSGSAALRIVVHQLIHLLTVRWEKLENNVCLVSINYFAGGVAGLIPKVTNDGKNS